MQDRLDWSPAPRIEPGSWHAKAPTQPASGDTRKSSVSLEPGSVDAKFMHWDGQKQYEEATS
jgi:hypothetical protein